MADDRDFRARIADNEAAFRRVNDAIEAGRGPVDADERLRFVCECGRLRCTATIGLTVGEYERVREWRRRFLVIEGHEADEREERVVERHDGWLVVEKVGEAGRRAAARDRRS